MLKLVAAFTLLGALAAGVFLVTIQGRTVADRWNAAPGPAAFAKNAWAECRSALTGDGRAAVPAPPRVSQPASRRPRSQQPESRRKPGRDAAVPTEHHTAEDRAELDRLLSERSP